MTTLGIIGVCLALVVAAQNAFVGIYVFPRLTGLAVPGSLVRVAQLSASLFFIGGALLNLQAAEQLLESDVVADHLYVGIYILRALGGAVFIWVTYFHLDIRLTPQGFQRLEKERSDLMRHLEYLATHDPLTGLLNATFFQERLDAHEAHVKRYGLDGAIIFFDLDGFKQANDNYGHKRGDMILAEVGRLFQARIRATDIAGRLGGDEFAILMPTGGLSEAKAFAEGILQALHERDWEGPSISSSVGIAVWEDSESSGHVLEQADAAMYNAKRAGGRQVAVHRSRKEQDKAL